MVNEKEDNENLRIVGRFAQLRNSISVTLLNLNIFTQPKNIIVLVSFQTEQGAIPP